MLSLSTHLICGEFRGSQLRSYLPGLRPKVIVFEKGEIDSGGAYIGIDNVPLFPLDLEGASKLASPCLKICNQARGQEEWGMEENFGCNSVIVPSLLTCLPKVGTHLETLPGGHFLCLFPISHDQHHSPSNCNFHILEVFPLL